ncbi:uncharacterized protein [Epargyreus clarus]|uniref:uncharacterized protein n=1 Tax=Epargyreus clarus TaxID=520877 RepID=UPI003C2B66DF
MDELRGPNIQIVLHVKEGLGFGFLKSPFVVSGSLNGYILETDSVVPVHAPVFDAELVWEADKRRFRSLRVQNVPVKVEVYTTGTQGRKDKVGYLLLSLLGAQPCPANKIVDVRHSWHKLLGVKSEGKCCHPQLLMSLSIEDRVSTPTPRNELRMFHSNEVAYPASSSRNPPTTRSHFKTLNEYIAESKKTVTSPDLQPRLICDEGLIQIGSGNQLLVLGLVIGSVENLDLLLPLSMIKKEATDCYVTYSVFTHTIMTDRVASTRSGEGFAAQFNQRTSLRLRSSLAHLAQYLSHCPHLVTRVCVDDTDVGICSLDLRMLVPTNDINHFLSNFCNRDKALVISSRCYILRCDDTMLEGTRRPYVDVEMSLQFVGFEHATLQKPPTLTARSATQLESDRQTEKEKGSLKLDCKSGSCTDIDREVGGVSYTNMAATNTTRYKTAAGDSVLQTNDIAEMIKKMCESFTTSQEKLLAARCRPTTSDVQIQCETEEVGSPRAGGDKGSDVCDRLEDRPTTSDNPIQCETEDIPCPQAGIRVVMCVWGWESDKLFVFLQYFFREPIRLETSKSDTWVNNNKKDPINTVLSSVDRDAIMQKFVEELEDWKERQQELFKCQLKRKEEYHLDLLAKEWAKKRVELECKLTKGIEQCRNLAGDLSRATEDFRLRGYRNTEREKKLLEAKKALEAHYTAKYQELRTASQHMEDDMRHQLQLKDMKIEELAAKIDQMDKQLDVLKTNLKNCEKDAESRYSGLTKDQTASLIQELRCLEEKLDSAVQSKAFFKEQWGRAVRELHLAKLAARRQLLLQLRQHRQQLGDPGLDTIEDLEENNSKDNHADIKKMKDDFYVDLLANTPALESHSIINSSCPDGMELYEELNATKKPLKDKLNELIAHRDSLIQQDSPDEEELKQLNQEIRSMLLNCGT